MAEMDYLSASVVGIALALLAGSGLFIIWSRIHTRHLHWALPVIGIAAVLIYITSHHQITQRYKEVERQAIFQSLVSIGHRIQSNLTTRLIETQALSAYLGLNTDISQAEYTRFLDRLVETPGIYTNIAAAPNLVVERIYPVINNESVLGMDYRTRDIQWPAIQQTIRTGEPVLIGPIELIQSGHALIIHDAVFDTDGNLWGVVAAVVPMAMVLGNSGLIEMTENFRMRIEGKQIGADTLYDVWSTPTPPETAWISHTEQVPHGEWQFTVEHIEPLQLPLNVRLALLAGMATVTLMIMVVTVMLARSRDQSTRARHSLATTAYMLDEAQRIGKMGSWNQSFNSGYCTLSPHLQTLLGTGERIPSSLWDRKVPQPSNLFVRHQLDQLTRREVSTVEMEHPLETRNGTIIVQHSAERVKAREPNGADLIVGNLIDITDKKEAERKLEHLAYYDSLTETPNRYYFRTELERVIKEHSERSDGLALLHIDLDHFKDINDSLGHQVGDGVLRVTSQRIKSALKPDDLLARTGGDEFMAILVDIPSPGDAAHIAQRIIQKLSSPMSIQSNEVFVGISIGVALYPDHAQNYEGMYQRADLALYRAKALGRGTVQVYADHMAEDFHRRTSLETAMRSALDNNEFSLVYQPRVDINSGKLKGLEALLRWNSRRYGQVMPDEFIPIAEESGQIITLGQWVIRTALKEFHQVMPMMATDVVLSVNLSPRQVQSRGLKDHITDLLEAYKIPGNRLELEITETSIISDYSQCEQFMRSLHQQHISFSLDDFGTGYSNLMSLRKLPLATLKIDKSFIRGIVSDPNHRAIVQSIIQLGHNLGMMVVAEGVEQQDHETILGELNCPQAQGFYYARPMNFDDLIAQHWITQSSA